MRVVIGTKNKAKTGAVTKVMSQHFPQVTFEFIDVASGVSEQPMSNEETRQGAINRAKASVLAVEGAACGFGLEGGVYEIDGQMYCCNWGAMALPTGEVYSCAGASFVLPEVVASRVRAGEELGPVMDDFTKTADIRHHAGAIGIFTNGLIDRKEMFEHITTLLVGQYMYFQTDL